MAKNRFGLRIEQIAALAVRIGIRRQQVEGEPPAAERGDVVEHASDVRPPFGCGNIELDVEYPARHRVVSGDNFRSIRREHTGRYTSQPGARTVDHRGGRVVPEVIEDTSGSSQIVDKGAVAAAEVVESNR